MLQDPFEAAQERPKTPPDHQIYRKNGPSVQSAHPLPAASCDFFLLPAMSYDSLLVLGAGGMRPQAIKIRRPLRSNGQRVVNHTQELSSNPFAKANTQ